MPYFLLSLGKAEMLCRVGKIKYLQSFPFRILLTYNSFTMK